MTALLRTSVLASALLFAAACGKDTTSADGAPPGDAGPPTEPCDSPGVTETVDCGACGTVERFCSAEGVWAYGTCGGEGECVPGTTEEASCGFCGHQMRRCLASCTWEPIGDCEGEGECAPGMAVRTTDGCAAGEVRNLLCSDACAYEPGPCGPETCDRPGALETVACGRCGSTQRFCTTEGRWEYGPCADEGECAPGTDGMAPCGNCGSQPARCDPTCAWVPMGACASEGECAPGEDVTTSDGCPSGQVRTLECDATCAATIVTEPCTASCAACPVSGPGTACGMTIEIRPYTVGTRFGGFQSHSGTSPSDPMTITFSRAVAEVSLTALDPDFTGNLMIARDASGAEVARVEFVGDDTPGVFTMDRQTVRGTAIHTIDLVPASTEYIAYDDLEIRADPPCP